MKATVKSWRDWGDPHCTGWNASGRDNIITSVVPCKTLDEIPDKLKAAGIVFTGYKVLSCDLTDSP